MTMIPFLVGVALGGALSFNGLGLRNVLAPAETLAAPIDSRILPFDAPAPVALAAVEEAWPPPLVRLHEMQSAPAPAAPPASDDYVPPPFMSWARNDTPAAPTLPAAAPTASYETAAIASEQVIPQSAAAHAQAIAEPSPRNTDPDASSPLDTLAAGDAAQDSNLRPDVAALIQGGVSLILKVDDVGSDLLRLEPR